jgi:hypothetical protein
VKTSAPRFQDGCGSTEGSRSEGEGQRARQAAGARGETVYGKEGEAKQAGARTGRHVWGDTRGGTGERVISGPAIVLTLHYTPVRQNSGMGSYSHKEKDAGRYHNAPLNAESTISILPQCSAVFRASAARGFLRCSKTAMISDKSPKRPSLDLLRPQDDKQPLFADSYTLVGIVIHKTIIELELNLTRSAKKHKAPCGRTFRALS